MTTLPNKELLRPDEVQQYFSLKSIQTVYNWIKTGRLRAYRTGKVLRIKREDVIKFKVRVE